MVKIPDVPPKRLLKGVIIGLLANTFGYIILSLFIHYTTKVDLAISSIPKLTGLTYFNSMHSEITAESTSGNLLKLEENDVAADLIYEKSLRIVDFFGRSPEFSFDTVTIVIIFLIPVLVTVVSSFLILYITEPDGYLDTIISACSVSTGFILFSLISPFIFGYTAGRNYPVELSIDLIQPLMITWLAYPIVVGTAVGTLYHKIPFQEVEKKSRKKNLLTILLIILVVLSAVFAYNAAIIPQHGEFEDQNEIHVGNSLSLRFDNLGDSRHMDVFYNKNYLDVEIAVDETVVNKPDYGYGFYRISKSDLQSSDSVVATISIGSNERTYKIDTDRFITLSGEKDIRTNQTYTYELNNKPSDKIGTGEFLLSSTNNFEPINRVQYNETGIKTFYNSSTIEIVSVSRESITLRYNSTGRYSISAAPKFRGERDTADILYLSSEIDVVAR